MPKVSMKSIPWGIKLSRAEARVFHEILDERADGKPWTTSEKRFACQLAKILALGDAASQRQLKIAITLRKTLATTTPGTQVERRREVRSLDRVAARKSLERFFAVGPGRLLAQPADESCWEALIDHEISRRSRIGEAPGDDDEEAKEG